MINLADAGIESPYATEAGSESDLTHGQPRLVDKLFRKVQAPSMSHRNRSCSQMSQEQAAKMTRTNSQVFCENLHSAILEATLTDQPQSP